MTEKKTKKIIKSQALFEYHRDLNRKKRANSTCFPVIHINQKIPGLKKNGSGLIPALLADNHS
ncbi:MAG: hypothetical protein QME28_03000 [Candidatus Saccharicenans sp.]|nr:hypothetical protein [Candidatus Saccharicenans sp.]